jgi:RNA polymerase sigma factor (sigma-70 family)
MAVTALESRISNLESRISNMDAAENERLYRECGAAGTLEQIDAFERLWALCYRLAYTMLRAQPDAEALAADCAQLALIKIERSLAQCQSPERFTAWAGQILRRSVLDELRRPERRRRADLAAAAELPTSAAGPATTAEGTDLAAQLRAAIATSGLSPRSQRVVLGRYFREQPDETLAAAESVISSTPVLPCHIQVTRAKNLAKLRADTTLLDRLRAYLTP